MRKLALAFRLFIKPFYEAHIGFLFGLLFFAFGFMRISYHVVLISLLGQHWFSILLLLPFWLWYTLKSLAFMQDLIRKKAYRFVFDLAFLSKRHQWQFSLYIFAVALLPILAYQLFMNSVLWPLKTWGSLIILWAIMLLELLLPPLWFLHRLRHPEQKPRWALSFRVKRHFSWSFMSWPLLYFLRKMPTRWFLTHVASIGILLLFFRFMPEPIPDSRYWATPILWAYGILGMLAYHQAQFVAQLFPMFFNLPISKSKRFPSLQGSLLLILLPEHILYGYLTYANGFSSILGGILLGHSIYFSAYAYNRHRFQLPDQWTTKLFATLVLSFFLLVFGIPYWGFILLLVAGSAYLLSRPKQAFISPYAN